MIVAKMNNVTGPCLCARGGGVSFTSNRRCGVPMKSYRCVFSYSGGSTTIAVVADTPAEAVETAAAAINAGDFDGVEVSDGGNVVLSRTTPRAWDALGERASPSAAPAPGRAVEQPETAPLPANSLPRRGPGLLFSGLRALERGAKTLRLPLRSRHGR